jgi:hypothetical protein
MTTRVMITYPEPGHAPEVGVYVHSPDGSIEYLLTKLKAGESTEQYVHSGQELLIKEIL